MKEKIGIAMVAAPFVTIFVAMGLDVGWLPALTLFGAIIGLLIWWTIAGNLMGF